MAIHVAYDLYIEDLPFNCIEDCTQPGQDAAGPVAYWVERLGFTVDRARAVKCLEGYGAWEAAELAAKSDTQIAELILWLACGDFKEWDGTEDSNSGSDVFVLE